MRRSAKLLLTAMVAGLTLVGLASPALAHNQLVKSDPAEGSSMATGPKQVTLTFDQPVQPGDFNTIAITGPKGGSWVDGSARVDGNTVTAKVRTLGPAGKYTVGYRILSSDGHPVSDDFRFTLTKPGGGKPAASPQADPGQPAQDGRQSGEESGGVPLWVWIAGAGVLLALGLFIALRSSSPSGGSSGGGSSGGRDAGRR